MRDADTPGPEGPEVPEFEGDGEFDDDDEYDRAYAAGSGCEPAPRGARPAANAPEIAQPENAYWIELERWGIRDDGQDAQGTTDGLNEAIAWAHANGYGTVRLGPGTYLVGEKINDKYTGAVVLPGDIVFELDPQATLQMVANDSWNYCVIDITARQDVVVRGGNIRGDRDAHVFAGGGAHDEGHGICIWGASERVRIEGMRISQTTGDGVLIVGGEGPGTSSKHITVRDNEIFKNRRQGVSIVGGRHVVIENNAIHHISGTAPQFGVDIESLGYRSEDILIRRNAFHHNQGGDYVNTDGRNVWLLENTMDQTGLDAPQTDGPIVHWAKTDQTIRGNTVTVTVGSSNGRWGIIGYGADRENPAGNYIEDNIFHGGGIHMANTRLVQVTGNTIHNWMILGTDIACLKLDDNAVYEEGLEKYKLRRVRGEASGNQVNGEPIELPMTHVEDFTNSPPHMW